MDKSYIYKHVIPKSTPRVLAIFALVFALPAAGAVVPAAIAQENDIRSGEDLAGGIVSDVLKGSIGDEVNNDAETSQDPTNADTVNPNQEDNNDLQFGDDTNTQIAVPIIGQDQRAANLAENLAANLDLDIQEEVPSECPPGFTLNSNGQCIEAEPPSLTCEPLGTEFSLVNGQCIDTEPATQTCAPLGTGFELVNGQCVRITIENPTCTVGTFDPVDRRCENVSGIPLPNARLQCRTAEGFVLTGTQCIKTETQQPSLTCAPLGTEFELVNGQCIDTEPATQTCEPLGTEFELVNGQCIDTEPATQTCEPLGTEFELVNGECQNPEPATQTCAPLGTGFELVNGECIDTEPVSLTCEPLGTEFELVNGECIDTEPVSLTCEPLGTEFELVNGECIDTEPPVSNAQ